MTIIASDSLLTGEQRRTLELLANMIVPADPERGMPGAGEIDLPVYLAEFARDAVEPIRAELDELNETARAWAGSGFTELDEASRQKLIEQLRAGDAQYARNVVVQVLCCYYQDERVVRALGVESTPPFPAGNDVDMGDLSLLDPVRERADVYRKRLYRS